MASGFGSNHADVIEFEEVAKLCPSEAKTFLELLVTNHVSLELFAQAFRWQERDLNLLMGEIDAQSDLPQSESWPRAQEVVKQIEEVYALLQEAFIKATTVGRAHLELEVGYHDQENAGDRYDEVSGCYWRVDGMYQLSSAGKKFKSIVERKHYVTYG